MTSLSRTHRHQSHCDGLTCRAASFGAPAWDAGFLSLSSLLDHSPHQSIRLDSVTQGSQGSRKSTARRAAGGSQQGPWGCLRRPCPVPLPVCAGGHVGVDTGPVWPRQPDSQLTVLPGSKSHRGTEQQPPRHTGDRAAGQGSWPPSLTAGLRGCSHQSCKGTTTATTTQQQC